jgi:hypothetical protein
MVDSIRIQVHGKNKAEKVKAFHVHVHDRKALDKIRNKKLNEALNHLFDVCEELIENQKDESRGFTFTLEEDKEEAAAAN